jgi:hypothetical protein
MLLDTWALAETVMKRWYWVLLGAIAFAALGGAYGWHRWKPYYLATAQLIRFDEQNSAEFFKYQEISQPTFVTILESPGLLESASRKAAPGITADDLHSRLAVLPARESDVVTITVEAESPERAVSLVNCYVTNAVDYLKRLQRDDAAKDNGYLSNQLAQMSQDIRDKKDNLKALPKFDPLRSTGPSSTGQQLQTAQGELDQALTKYTDQHPDVKAKKQLVAQLRQRLEQESTNAPPLVAAPGKTVETDSELLRLEIQMLENNRILLQTRQREAEQYSKNPPGYCRVFAMADMKDAIYIDPKMKIGFLGILGGFGGIMLISRTDSALRTGRQSGQDSDGLEAGRSPPGHRNPRRCEQNASRRTGQLGVPHLDRDAKPSQPLRQPRNGLRNHFQRSWTRPFNLDSAACQSRKSVRIPRADNRHAPFASFHAGRP